MTSYIRLTPTPEENTYIVFEGEKTTKKVGLFSRREIIPIIFVSFKNDISSITEEHEIRYNLDCSLQVGSFSMVPTAQLLAVGTVKPYESGVVVVETSQLPIIDQYRAMRVIEALPLMRVRDLSDVRSAQKFVIANRDQKKRRVCASAIAALAPMERELKERYISSVISCLEGLPRDMYASLNLNDLMSCLESLPTDIYGNRLSLEEEVGLVLVKPDMGDEALKEILAQHTKV